MKIIKEIKMKLEFTSREKFKEMLKSFQYSLVESVYLKQSLLIRLILKDFFNKEYNCNDSDLMQFIIEADYVPQIFSKEIESENILLKLHSADSFERMLNNILEMNLEYKKFGTLFETYVTSYPFSRIKAMEEIKLFQGRILVYENFFIWFTDYIPHYKRKVDMLMHDDGLIPTDWRYFIAIMAVSTMRCQYLFDKLKEEFLLRGGNEEWVIKGLPSVPSKLQNISKLNNILAHQPWKLTRIDLNEIFSKSWSREELLHAASIMMFYHKLATITESIKFKIVESHGLLPQRTPSFSSTEAKEEREGKINLYNHLLQMNEETEETEEIKIKVERKFSNGDDPKIVYFIEDDHSQFNSFISNHCTLYLDFDAHSDNILSNLVSLK